MVFFHSKVQRYRRLALLAFFLIVPLSVAAQKNWLSFTPHATGGTGATAGAKPVMKFIERGPNGYVIDYEFPGAPLTGIEENDRPYQLLHVDQFGKLQYPGRPALPARQFTFAVPAGHRAVVHLLSSRTTEYSGYTIYPARKPALDYIGAKEPAFEIDEAFYESDVLYPSDPVSLVNEQLYRGNKIVRVQICPVQCNPARKRLITYAKMRFEVRFLPEESAPLSIYRPSRLGNKILSNIADNGTMVISVNEQSGIAPLDAPVDDIPHPAGGLVIVTVDDFLPAAETLADWKRRMGYEVEIISQSSWASSDAVRDTIHDRYASMPEGLDFALILGDHEFVPSEISDDGYARHVTDLYFACMDGSGDFTPDIGIGRIPAASATEAATIVNKIITYERTPVTDNDFYRHGLSAAYFQHAGNGYAERRFAQTSWEIRQYLINNFSYSVDRQFVTGSSVNPLYWNNGYYSNGEPIPDYLQRPNYAWDGNATDISAGINDGRFFVFHRDHGGETVWGDPYYTVSDINALNNGDLLPVVFSINCLTGKFDYSGTCFSEAFIRHANGGAVGVFCASEVSLSGQNDGLAEGFIDAIWPDPGLVPAFPHNPTPNVTPHDPIYRMGAVLTQGKLRMSETWNGGTPPFSYEQYSYELFHYFGDPTMHMWTDIPQNITASYPAVLMIGQSTYAITGANCDGIATLYFDGQFIGSCRLTNGNGQMDIEPLPTTAGTAELTINAHNFRPLEAEISVIPGGDAIFITAPTAGTLFDQGEITTITWQTFGTIPNVSIEFSTDGGLNYTTVESSITNNNAYTWNVPDVESDQCIVRVADLDDDPSDESDQFSIHNLSLISGTVTGNNLPALIDYQGPLSGALATDANGDFLIDRLLPGDYDLCAQDGPYVSDTVTLTVPPDRTNVSIAIRYPNIDVFPTSLSETLPPGETSQQTITISNTGDADLHFTAETRELSGNTTAPPEATYPASHFEPMVKGAVDERIGMSVTDGQGGPDAFGYKWIDSDEPGGPAYSWTDISTTGTVLSTVSSCDDCNQSVSLGFPFEYYGQAYTTVYVSSNGYITFGSGASSYTNYPLPSTSAPAGIVAPFFDDLYPVGGGDIYFEDFGDHAVIQFDDVIHIGGSGVYTFQIHILDNNKIRFFYNTLEGTLNSATVGWQNSTRDDGHTIAYNTAYLHEGLAVEIAAAPDWLLVTPESGTVPPGGSTTLAVTFDATELTTGTWSGQINIDHDDPDEENPFPVACDLTVTAGNLPPTAVAAADPTSGIPPLSVSFDGTGSSDPDGDPLTYAWDFGDGTAGNGVTISHTYTNEGIFTARLIVDDGNGGTDTATVSINVHFNHPPTAVMSAVPTSGEIPLAVSFDGSASSDPDGDILTYSWDFGDGTTGNGATVSHTYTTADTFTASLTVDDGNGGSDIATISISATASNYQPGLIAEFFNYTTSLSSLPNLSGATPTVVRLDDQVNYPSTNDAWTGLSSVFEETFASRHTGFIHIPTSGDYTFYLNSDDGSRLWLGGSMLIDNDGVHPMREYSGTVYLDAGYHPLRIEFFENTGGAGLIFSWQGPGTGKEVVPANVLFNNDDMNFPPTAVISATPTSGIVPLTVSFDGSASSDPDGDALTYLWDFGDGTSATDVVVDHFYNTVGTYTVTLTVDDGNGNSDQDSVTVHVTPQGPSPFLQSSDSDGIVSMEVEHFHHNISQSGKNWVASGSGGYSGDGAMVTSPNTGTYYNTGYVTSSPRLDFEVEFVHTGIHYLWARGIGASANDDSYHGGLDGAAISSCDRISSFGTSWTWSRSTMDNTPATFSVASTGVHTVNVWMREDGFVIDKIVITTDPNYTPSNMGPPESPHAATNRPPTAVADADPLSGTVPLTVAFDGSRSTDPDGDALTYAWDFGDGNSGSGVTVSHTFTAVGTFTATLTVDDGNGGTDDTTIIITVPNRPPVANMTATPDMGDMPLDVTFDGSASSDPDGDALSFSWDFGDGIAGTGSVTTHTYTDTGMFTASLIVNDGNGGEDTTQQVITVTRPPNLPPTAVINANPVSGQLPLAVTFDGSASTDPDNDVLTFAWDFGDGSTGSGITVNYIYMSAGTFTATLIVDDGNGGTDHDSVTITVTTLNDTPVVVTPASATPNPVSGTTTSLNVLGDDDGGESNLIYTWSVASAPSGGSAGFSVNGTNSSKTTTATFSAAGDYHLVVTITDTGSLSTTSEIIVTVNQETSAITVTPQTTTVTVNESQVFTANAVDQFGNPMSPAPSFTWSVSGGGSIDVSGLFTAGATAGGPYTVTAQVNGISGTAEVTVELTATGIYVYDDALAAGYSNYSWSTNCNFSDNSPVHDGTYSLAIDYTSGWAGLLLQNDSQAQSHSVFSAYSFWGHGGSSGTRRCQFFTRNSSGQESVHFEFELPADTWTLITIPLSALGNPADAQAVMIQDVTGADQPEFNIDELMLQ